VSVFPPGTPAADVLQWLGEVANARPDAGTTDEPVDDDVPFLSVLLRTQGRRPATLEDTLLTLAAQNCDSFEVLVLVHDPADGTVNAIEEMVGGFHAEFARRVRVLAVEGGSRSRPLNEGARRARGRYLAMLDDDDLAFAHWVAAFKAAAERAPGRVVRCCVATQVVRSLPGAWDGVDGYEVVNRPHVDYPLVFDYLDHLVDNRTPNNGYAVPRRAVVDLGLGWDETLPVLEDWDHLMRAVAICGVESTPTVSALLRSWTGGSSSKTAHSETEWEKTHRLVEDRHTAVPVLFPKGAAASLRARAARDEARAALMNEVRRLRNDARHMSASVDSAEHRLQAVDDDVAALQRALADARAQLAAMRSSTTWRVGKMAHAPVSLARRLTASLRAGRPLRAGPPPQDAPS
jgi:Glycosyl transferase family 2